MFLPHVSLPPSLVQELFIALIAWIHHALVLRFYMVPKTTFVSENFVTNGAGVRFSFMNLFNVSF